MNLLKIGWLQKDEMVWNAQLQLTHEERLAEENMRKIMELRRMILRLERLRNAKQKLELDVEMLKGKMRVMKPMGDDADHDVQKQIQQVAVELRNKTAALAIRTEELKSMEESYVHGA